MHQLKQITSGELRGAKHIHLKCDLTEFPPELFLLADTLETLDLSGNRLSTLPSEFYKFKKLKILFCSDNLFNELPEVLGQCEQLEMIGFKSNQIKHIPENALPIRTRWLILTNNKIENIPSSIGKCLRLQKCALAGNRLKALPEEFQNCTNLELLRISANSMESFPEFLFKLPKLSWLAISGNTFNQKQNNNGLLKKISWRDVTINHQLGEGASGHIYQAVYKQGALEKNVAVKVFKGQVTSDGYPEDEMQTCISAGEHKNLYGLIGTLVDHPQQKMGLVMNLIPEQFHNLGQPPSLQTCTRDTFEKHVTFNLEQVHRIVLQIAEVCYHLHERGILHGDLYAHNILVDEEYNALLGDFGAAGFYDKSAHTAESFQKMEVRAWACLLDDLLNLIHLSDFTNPSYLKLCNLRDACLHSDLTMRPSFDEIIKKLDS